MSKNNSVEENRGDNSSEKVEKEIPETHHTLTQEVVNEQVKVFFAALKRQLEESTWHLHGILTTLHPSHNPSTGYSTISGTTAHLHDKQLCAMNFQNVGQ